MVLKEKVIKIRERKRELNDFKIQISDLVSKEKIVNEIYFLKLMNKH